MKMSLTILCICACLFASSQGVFKIQINADYNVAEQIIQLADGSYVSAGYLSSGFYIVKLNAAGGVVYTKTIGTTNYGIGHGITKTADGGFAVCGVVNNEMTVMKFDADVTLQWQRSYFPKNASAEGTRLIETTDGGFLIAGKIKSDLRGEAAFLLKTNNTGTVIFSKQYFDFEDNYAVDITATNDGNYALLVNTDDIHFTKYGTCLLKIKPDGSLIWQQYIDNGNLSTYPESLLATSDGSLIVGGSAETIVQFNGRNRHIAQMMMTKFDESGNTLWSKNMVTSKLRGTYSSCVLEDKDGSYVFAGAVDPDNTDTSNAYLVKLNETGALVWTKTYDASVRNYTTFSSLIPTLDGGYMASGNGYYLKNNSEQTSVFYKFDGGFETCSAGSGSQGSIANFVQGVSKIVIVKDIVTSVSSVAVTAKSAGTGINLCTTLPLSLISFNASLQNKSVNLQWQTANEINTSYFTLQRSANGTIFSAVQKVAASGTSAAIKTYAATDLNPLGGTSYYRLQMVDKDGSTTYSSIVPVMLSTTDAAIIFPNPVTANVRVLMQSEVSAKAVIQITDITGKILRFQNAVLYPGSNTIIVAANGLSKGIYVLKIIEGGRVQTIKFIKQ